MWECNFAKETMDYKLFWLRFVKKIWIIVVATVLGALIVGVPYYLVNITFGPAPSYKVVSEYYLDYAEDSSGKTYDYFNYYTWSEIANTDEFIGLLKKHLPEDVLLDDATLRAYTDATVESDTRYLYTIALTKNADTSLKIARAMENAILEFGNIQKELKSVKVITMPQNAKETYPDVRAVRAFILGALIGLFIGAIGVSAYIICDSSVYLPNVMEKRYKIKGLGCQTFGESKNNICYALKGCKNVALLWAGNCESKQSDEAVEFIKIIVASSCVVNAIKQDVLATEFDFEAIRNKDAVVLMVEAGAKNGKMIERVIEQIKRQDIKLSGAFLYNENKKLINHYYR